MSTGTTKHNKPVVVAAQDREEDLSFNIRNNNKRRKIKNEDDVNNDDDTTGDNDDIMTQRQSQLLCWCTFHDFRSSTIYRTALCTVRLIRTVVRD